MATHNFDESFRGLQLKAEQAQIRKEVRQAERHAGKAGVCLPSIPKEMRLAPHIVFRTALFSVMSDKNKKDGIREFVNDREIAGLSNMKASLTGQLLDQQDLDVLLAVLDMARGQPFSGVVAVPARRLLLAQGKGDDGRSYSELEASLTRLAGAVLKIDQGGSKFIGALLISATRQSGSEIWTIRFALEFLELFGPGGFACLNFKVRALLNGKPLAKWLDGYYSSQPKAHALKVETVRRYSGSECKELRSFKQTLTKALNAVARARAEGGGDTFDWKFDSDGLLKVITRPRSIQKA